MAQTSDVDAYKFHKMKEEAISFYSKNNVQDKLEMALNDMFFDNPDDVYGYLAMYFEKFVHTPKIVEIQSRLTLDTCACITLETDIYCNVRNSKQLVTRCMSSNYSDVPETAKTDCIFAAEEKRKISTQAAMDIINGDISVALLDRRPENQQEIDDIIREIVNSIEPSVVEEPVVTETEIKPASGGKNSKKSPKGKRKTPHIVLPPEVPHPLPPVGSVCLPAVSKAVCMAGARVKNREIYDHILSLSSEKEQKNFQLPQPVITVLQGGKLTPSKNNCMREVCLVPSPDMPLSQVITVISSIYAHLRKTILTKFPAFAHLAMTGGVLPALHDKPEQVLDIVYDAITEQELEPGRHISIIINCAGHEIVDMDKGKYELFTTMVRTADETVEFWTDLVTRYPAVIGLIDPFRKEEAKQWNDLTYKLSEKCFIIGNYAIAESSICSIGDGDFPIKLNSAMLCLNRTRTISDLVASSTNMKEKNIEPIISTSKGESVDSFIVDLAVGMGVRFIKIGPPSRGENVIKLHRLHAIEETLNKLGQLSRHGPYTFFQIAPEPEALLETTEHV